MIPMGLFFLTIFISCGHGLYIGVEHMGTCEGNKKGGRGGGGEWNFCLSLEPYSKISLVIIICFFFLTMYKSHV